MKAHLFIFALLLCAIGATAAPILGTATPGNAALATPTGPSIKFGTLYNFDLLTANSTFNPATYAANGVNISSPDGLVVSPYSTQSGPNYLFDNSAAGSASITIRTSVTNQIGIGIADSDLTAAGTPVSITLQALNAAGVGFGNIFTVTIPTTGPTSGNGYFIVSDNAYDIYGLAILQPVSNSSLYSGLALDDLQVAPTPEPTTYALLGSGLLLAAAFRRRRTE